jgi:hypothetical protein
MPGPAAQSPKHEPAAHATEPTSKPASDVEAKSASKPPEQHLSGDRPKSGSDVPLAEEKVDGGHHVSVTEEGIELCSPKPCPLLNREYAKEMEQDPGLKKRFEDIQTIRKAQPKEAARRAAELQKELQQLREATAGEAPLSAGSTQKPKGVATAKRSKATNPPGKPEKGTAREKRLLGADQPGEQTAERFTLREPAKKGEAANSLERIAEALEQNNAQLAKLGKPTVKLNPAVLEMRADEFILKDPELAAEWERFELVVQSKESPLIRQSSKYRNLPEAYKNLGPDSMRQLREDFSKFQKGLIGAKKPDVVDFFLDQNRAVVTDITKQINSPWHKFKSDVYRKSLRELTGLEVGTVDTGGAIREATRIVPK